MDGQATKEKILYASIMLFSGFGYEAVSMRDIAAKVGIKAASIYNHYTSKDDILNSAYDYYARNEVAVTPCLDKLLQMAETEPVENVFASMNFQHPPEIQDYMDRIVIIASRRLFGNEDDAGEKFIRKYVFDKIHRITVTLITKMIELGKIEPIDAELFASILANYSFGTAALTYSSMCPHQEQWKNATAMLLSLIKKK